STGQEILTNKSTIQGAGNIGNGFMGLVNSGTILANQSNALVIDPSTAGFNNKATLNVSSGSTMSITGPANSFLNYNNATRTLTGGTYLVGGTLQIPGDITTNAATITLSATGAQIIDASSHNALATLTTNAAAGNFSLNGSNTLTTTAGSISNAGTFKVFS